MVSISVQDVPAVDLLSEYGDIGESVENSIYVRDYCFMCDEPIRVPMEQIGKPNSCSFCQPALRGRPGVAEFERVFWENIELSGLRREL